MGPRRAQEDDQGLGDVDLRRPRRGRGRDVFIGTLFGALAGYYGKWVDDFFNWFYSVFSSIPYLLLILAVAAVLQQKGTLTIILILGLTGWTGIFRLIRGEYLKHKAREYVQAADAIGASNARRMFVHIFPNVSHVVLVQLSIYTVGFIKAEVILSFLGFGVPVDVVSWGSMLNEAQNELILGKWWQLVAARYGDGDARDGVQPLHRRAARRARSEAQGKDGGVSMATGTMPIRSSASEPEGRVPARQGHDLRGGQGHLVRHPAATATVALVGESGSGKSVTSLAILGLLPPENSIVDPASEILFDGRNLVELDRPTLRELRGADISMIFQEPMTSLNPVFTVGFQLTEVLRLHMGMKPAQARKRAIELLDEVGIPDPEYKINAYPVADVGRPAAARDDRDGDRLRAQAPDRRRADDRARRHDPEADPRPHRRAAEEAPDVGAVHHARSRGRRRDRRLRRRDAQRRDPASRAPRSACSRSRATRTRRRCCKCRPQLDRRPVRLPVIDDFMDGGTLHRDDMSERVRGVNAVGSDRPRRARTSARISIRAKASSARASSRR